jgi:hypothetical protein
MERNNSKTRGINIGKSDFPKTEIFMSNKRIVIVGDLLLRELN